ncbi:hypothetical protein SLEP1_g17183 [Rubroshorea leprosula]|uniref:Uncharacterized protein n=1 Tax=Rubroshorea leprosula TaxID=152421 RepID=A0AAV5IZA4_9ROSI|nr:hypothetical protein SLEP1_g17183 [Rubroshorea leprosula]
MHRLHISHNEPSFPLMVGRKIFPTINGEHLLGRSDTMDGPYSGIIVWIADLPLSALPVYSFLGISSCILLDFW